MAGLVARELGSELPAANVPAKFNRVRRLAKLFTSWPHDAMRHSFASYHLAKHRHENETALVLGNSPQMIFSHYREVVRELCDVHGLSPSTAYAALSPQGRFREHLREADGGLAWNSFPERTPAR